MKKKIVCIISLRSKLFKFPQRVFINRMLCKRLCNINYKKTTRIKDVIVYKVQNPVKFIKYKKENIALDSPGVLIAHQSVHEDFNSFRSSEESGGMQRMSS
jgi:hypothetical protein